jgi:hypothetical protein
LQEKSNPTPNLSMICEVLCGLRSRIATYPSHRAARSLC